MSYPARAEGLGKYDKQIHSHLQLNCWDRWESSLYTYIYIYIYIYVCVCVCVCVCVNVFSKNRLKKLWFLYLHFCPYWPICVYGLVLTFLWDSQTRIFSLLRNIWRIKTKNNLRIPFPPRLFDNTFFLSN